MSNHITENLVEQVAVVAYEDVRKKNQDKHMPSWVGAPAITRYEMKANVLGVLRMVIPVLDEQGWLPPACESCLHQHGADICGSDLGEDSVCWCQTESGAK